MVFVARSGLQMFVRHALGQARDPGLEDPLDPLRRSRVDSAELHQTLAEGRHLRVCVDRRDPTDRPLLIDEVDRVPVCEARYEEGREVRERRREIERAAEELARL